MAVRLELLMNEVGDERVKREVPCTSLHNTTR